ncbi:MAG: hypothetical protein AAFN70_09000, partial [Planctomycetota bacterium]
MRAHNAADLTGEAVAGAGGTVSIAAQAAVIKDSSSERIRLAEDAFLFGQQRLSMIAGRNQTINATAIGGQAGGFVAGAAIAQTDVTGSTIVDIGNNTTLNAANVVIGTDTNIVTDAVSRSVAVGGITAAASDARSSITPTIQTRIGDNALIRGEQTVVETLARINGKSDALGTGVGIAATGPSVSRSEVHPTMSTIIGNEADFAATELVQLRTGLQRFSNGQRTVQSESTASSGGGLAISAGTSDAVLSGSVDTVLGDGIQFRSEQIHITSTTETNTMAQMLAAAGAIIAAGDSDADARSQIANAVRIGNALTVTDAQELLILADGNNAAVAYDVSGTGGVISGASARASTLNTSQSLVNWDDTIDDHPIDVDSLIVHADQTAIVRSAVDSINASLGGGVGVNVTNRVNSRSDVMLGRGVDVSADTISVQALNRVVKELPQLSKPSIDKDGDGNFSTEETGKPVAFDVDSGSGGAIDVPSASSETIANGVAAVVIDGTLNARDSLLVHATPTLDLTDRVRLTSGGAVSGVAAKSVILANPTASVTVAGDLRSDGELLVGAAPAGSVRAQSIGKGFGLAGAVTGQSAAIVNPRNTLHLLDGAIVEANGD